MKKEIRTHSFGKLRIYLKTGENIKSKTLLRKIFPARMYGYLVKMAKEDKIMHVNFADAEFTKSSGEEFTCLRGESVLSYSTWGHILGWSRGRVKRFFNSCFSDGSIELVEGGGKSHIRVTRYDA